MARCFIALASLAAVPAAAPAEQTAPFSAVELRSGGHVTVRHGATYQVSFSEGDSGHTRISVAGGRLLIDNCPITCPRGYSPSIDVVTPRLESVAVSSGGTITVEQGFPVQAGIAVAVGNGGSIDVRAFPRHM